MTSFQGHTHPDDTSELLSSYLDDALDAAERRRVDDLLQTCPGCAADVADLRTLRAALRALPAPLPRRSFTLDPAVVHPRSRLFPVFRFASLAAAVLLFLVLGFDALSSQRGRVASTASAPASGAATGAETYSSGGGAAAGAAPKAAEAPATAAAALSAQDTGAATPETASGAAATAEVAAGAAPAAAGKAAPAQSTAGVAAAAAASGGAASAGIAGTTGPAGSTTDQLARAPQPLPSRPTAGAARPVAPQPAVSVPPAGAEQAQGKANSSAARTTSSQETATSSTASAAPSALRPIHVLEYLLVAITLSCGFATWWIARRR